MMRNRVLCLSACLLVSCVNPPQTVPVSAAVSGALSTPEPKPSTSAPVVFTVPQPSAAATAMPSPGATAAAAASATATPAVASASPSPLPSPASATPAPAQLLALTGHDLDVSRVKSMYQGEASVGIDDKGHFVVVWLRLESTDSVNIYAQRFDAGGTPKGAPITVNPEPIKLSETGKYYANAGLYENPPQVAMGAAGNFAVLYGKADGLYLRSYSNAGWALAEPVRVATVSGDVGPAFAALPGDRWVAAWRSQYGMLQVQRFNESGKTAGSSHQPFGAYGNSSLAVSPDGHFLLASGSQAQRYDARGLPSGKPFTLEQGLNSGIAMDRDGNLLTTSAGSGATGIWARRYSKSNEALGERFQASEKPLDYADRPLTRALMDLKGRSAVLWGEARHQSASGSISLRRFDAKGQALEKEYQVNNLTDGFSSKPAAAGNAAGRFVVAWQNWDDNQGEYRILAKVLDLDQVLPPSQLTPPAPVDCSKEALDKLAPVYPTTPEQEALKQQAESKPDYTGPIEIRVKVGSQSVDPRTPGALNGLPAATSGVSSVSINGGSSVSFQQGTLIALPRKTGCFAEFLSLYEAERVDELSGSMLIRLKLSKAPVERIEEILRAFNKKSPTNLTSIEFSSVEAMQTFLIFLDISLNYAHYFNAVSINPLFGSP